MNIDLDGFDAIHRIGKNATSVIAPFSSPLTALLLLAECSVASSSRLVSRLEKGTLTLVQLPFLG